VQVRRRWPVLPLVLLLLTACGTRLPDSDFAGEAAGAAAPSQGPSSAPGKRQAGGPGATTGPTAGATAGSTAGPASQATASAGPGAAANTASDVGVTATTITLGTISSRTNAFDPTAFVGPTYGVQAFVDDLNRHGGLHGRTVRLPWPWRWAARPRGPARRWSA
jgi:hypothetical protein